MCKNPSSDPASGSSSKAPYDWTPCKGCYLEKVRVYNIDTGESFRPVCKSYRCQKHGWMHQKRLETAIATLLKSWPVVRMWTFTLSSKVAETSEDHARILSQCWRYFITELRRNRLLSKKEQATQYVRFAEPHRSGFFHLHVLVNNYIHWVKVQALWVHACETVTGRQDKIAHCNVRGSKSVAGASKYVAKYVTKSAQLAPKNMKLWTRSSRIAIFKKSVRIHEYVVHHELTGIWFGVFDGSPLNLSPKTTSSQPHAENNLLELFPGLLDPGDDDYYTNH